MKKTDQQIDDNRLPRFFNYVYPEPNTGCWIWAGATMSVGYGLFSIGRLKEGRVLAHRFSYELAFGKIPSNKLLCHTCDNRWCVNPEHLFVGTHRDNTLDMVSKNRHITTIPFSIITDIRTYKEVTNESARKIAIRFGVSDTHVRDICNRKRRINN